jgi:hypothetical protein
VTQQDLEGKNARFDTPLGFVERLAAVDNVVTI